MHDVLIVGFGPVGAVAANLAGRAGLDALVVDGQTDIYPLPRAIHLDADVMRVLQAAGVAGEVEPTMRATSGAVHLGADGEPTRRFRVPGVRGDLGWKPHYMFFQPALEAVLRERAAAHPSVEVALGRTVERVEQDPEVVTASVRAADGTVSEVRARWLLACDGASSPMRKAVAPGVDDLGFDEPWVIIDLLVPDEDLGPDHNVMYCDPRRPGTYIPGPGRLRRWEFMLLPGEEPEDMRGDATVRELVGRVTPWLDVAQAEVLRCAVYRFHALVADRWRTGRILLAGDAAHQTPPFFGQGMGHGLRDVRNAIWKIAHVADGRAAPGLLDSYQPEREPHVRAIIDAAVEAGRGICMLDPVAAARRDEALRARAQAGGDVSSFRELVPGLTAGLMAPGAGQGLPQPLVRGSDGDEVLLDELLGDGFAVVTTLPPSDGPDLRWLQETLRGRVVVVDDELIAAWLAARGATTAVVRPDRYVFALAASEDDLAGALRDLARALGVPAPTPTP